MIPSWLRDNLSFILSFPARGYSRENTKLLMNLTEDQSDYMDELPILGVGVMSDIRFDRLFLVQILGDIDDTPKPQAEVQKIMQPRIKVLHDKLYRREQEAINEAKKYEIDRQKKTQHSITDYALHVLKLISKYPFAHKTDIIKTINLTQSQIKQTINFLDKQKLVVEHHLPKGKTKKAWYYALTEKGQDFIDLPKSHRINPQIYVHTLFCHQIKQWLEHQGLTAKLEHMPSHSNIDARIDVYCPETGTAYEVQRSTSHLYENVTKCLIQYNISHLELVCENSNAYKIFKDKLKEKFPEKIYKQINPQIEYSTVRKFQQLKK
jgi:DNA-binding MarR family transcriptional regulator